MTTSRHDLAHGRQGGRIVDWIPGDRPPIGPGVTLAAGVIGPDPVAVSVIEHLPAGRCRIGFRHVADLVVADRHLEVAK